MSAVRPRPGIERARKIARRELALGLALLAALALAGWISTVAIDGLPWAQPYELRLSLRPGAPLLHSGDEVRMAGERVGQVGAVELARGSGTRAVATLELSGVRAGAGAMAKIRPRGMAGAVFVDIEPGDGSHPLASGTTIPSSGAVQLTDVIAGFDGAARRALAASLAGYGTALGGRGVELGQALGAAPGLLGDATAVLDAVQPSRGTLAASVADARAVAGAVAAPALGAAVHGASGVLSATGARSAATAQTVRELPALEAAAGAVVPHAVKLIAALTRASSVLAPGVDALAASLPGVNRLEAQGSAVSILAGLAARTAPVLGALTPALARLGGPAAGLAPLSTPAWEIARVLAPYRQELIQAPLGFTRWGNDTYGFGTAPGHRAVRFSMVMTCALARDPYPAPGAAAQERRPCP